MNDTTDAPTPTTPEPPRAEWRYTERFLRALDVAARMHAAQTRKGGSIPYVSHLLGTCAIALENGADEDQAIAALLHDAIEDIEPVAEARVAVASFGPEVLRIVEACSNGDAGSKGDWRTRRTAYLGHLAANDAAVLLVSASDKLHNARTIVADLRRTGVGYLDRFSAGREGVLWYYPALVEAYLGNPAHPRALVDELARVVAEMELLATSMPPADRACIPPETRLRWLCPLRA